MHINRGAASTVSDVLMVSAKSSSSEELLSLYDLEYRAGEDDAWYSVYVVLDSDAQTLTIKYLCSPVVYEIVLSSGQFETESQVDELVARFRPVSRQMQDHQCGELSVGTTVCAAHGTLDNDLRFYDAVIEAVDHQVHSFAGEEEECLCIFLLAWNHGRGRGTLTSSNIASICMLDPATQIDNRITSFATMAKEKIRSSISISVSGGKNLGSSQIKLLEMDASIMSKSLICEDPGKNINNTQWTSQDEDMGPKYCGFDRFSIADDHILILISNMEKDITPSSIKNFIYKQTSILPLAFVFPRLLSDPFARGAVMVNCPKRAQIIYDFLDNPNHLVVSSRGRPWIITEKASAGAFGTNIWNLIHIALDEIKHIKTDEELELVHLGTESYKRARQLKDLFVEFMHHESRLCEKLALEEKKIILSCKST